MDFPGDFGIFQGWFMDFPGENLGFSRGIWDPAETWDFSDEFEISKGDFWDFPGMILGFSRRNFCSFPGGIWDFPGGKFGIFQTNLGFSRG